MSCIKYVIYQLVIKMLLWRRMNMQSGMLIVHTSRQCSIEMPTPRVDGVYGFFDNASVRMPHFQITAFLMRFVGNRGERGLPFGLCIYGFRTSNRSYEARATTPNFGLSWTLLLAAKGAKRVATSDNGMDLTKSCSQKGELKCSSLP